MYYAKKRGGGRCTIKNTFDCFINVEKLIY